MLFNFAGETDIGLSLTASFTEYIYIGDNCRKNNNLENYDALILLVEEAEALELAIETIENPEFVYRRISKDGQIAKAIFLLIKMNELKQAENLLTKHYPANIKDWLKYKQFRIMM